ncbi:MAG TPA: ABC transporter substrate-binding protein [Mesotoga sp.]|nr:ABC transporter substrate-binding protein [Mesotoga sp.]MDI9375144.1 ABC transporter substrate-binding protein [Thermotogota bacterium]NLX33602.1 ABC transporter substrate-binding protein [Thermotogaceae bacterium]MDD4039643.1 ABC transporter substrate-binding protein [Mesotoga sp.]MDD4478217.1 ABC transporter substrate-binding protein [Mesotoga sp.]
MRKLLLTLMVVLVALVAFSQIVLTVAAGAVGQELELTKQAAEAYMSIHPDITVKVLDTPDMVQDRLGLYLQFLEAKSPEIDVYQVDVIWPGDLAQHFIDFYEYNADKVVSMHFPAIVENNTVDGKLVAIPWFTDAGLLYYRTDLLEKYGLKPPTTWDELENAAKIIQEGERKTNPDFWGFVWQGNAYEGLTCDALEWLASNDAGTIISPDKKITIANANAIEILEKVAGWIGTISPSGVLTFAEEDARAVWQTGNAAFMRNWPYCYSLSKGPDSNVAGKFDVSPLPAGKSGNGAATLGGWQLSVSKYSKNPKEAADLALFMAGYEIQKLRAVEGSMNPTIQALYADYEVIKANPFFGSLFDVFINAVARPSTATAPRYNEVSTLFFKAVHRILSGTSDAQNVLEELALDLQDITGFEIVWGF